MSTTTTTDEPWIPATEAEQALKDAFAGLEASNARAVIPATVATPKRFVMHTRGYYDLRAYVLAGKTLPRDIAEFQAKMPKSAFSSLLTIDPLIYDKTRDTMTAISSSCAKYHEQRLGQMVTVATSAAQYASMAIRHLTEVPDMNLKDNLNILLDTKYSGSTTFDDTYFEAKDAARDTLTNLNKGALARKVEVNSVITGLIAFKEDTIAHLENVVFLNKQYSTGPVVNNSSVKTPYLKWLNAELKADIDAFYDALAQAKSTWGDYEKARDTAIGLAFVPFGWIGSIVKGIEAEELKAKYNSLMAKAEDFKRQWQEGELLVNYVTQLVNQCDKIDDLMDAAIDAMAELSSLFSKQANCYTIIGDSLDALDTAVDARTAKSRRSGINNNVDSTLAGLVELRMLAESFADAILREVEFATDDLSAPAE